MGAFTDSGKNEMLDASTITHAALTNGGVELSGGSPAYARQPVTLVAASGGQILITVDETFDVPAGSTVDGVEYYDALTAGTKKASDPVTAEVYAAQGQYILDSSTFTLAD